MNFTYENATCNEMNNSHQSMAFSLDEITAKIDEIVLHSDTNIGQIIFRSFQNLPRSFFEYEQ